MDDGSTDTPAEIVAEYDLRWPFIRLVRRGDRCHRSVCPGLIEAFYAGYDAIRIEDYAFIGKLDLDLEPPPTYFETLLRKFEANPCLGPFSGKVRLRRDAPEAR